jgi:AbrB family looped-hinge helix DNA binding protein
MPRVTTRGRITIPKRIRDALGFHAGAEVEIRMEGATIRLRRVEDRKAIDWWRGAIGLGEPVDDFVDQARGDR